MRVVLPITPLKYVRANPAVGNDSPSVYLLASCFALYSVPDMAANNPLLSGSDDNEDTLDLLQEAPKL